MNYNYFISLILTLWLLTSCTKLWVHCSAVPKFNFHSGSQGSILENLRNQGRSASFTSLATLQEWRASFSDVAWIDTLPLLPLAQQLSLTCLDTSVEGELSRTPRIRLLLIFSPWCKSSLCSQLTALTLARLYNQPFSTLLPSSDCHIILHFCSKFFIPITNSSVDRSYPSSLLVNFHSSYSTFPSADHISIAY